MSGVNLGSAWGKIEISTDQAEQSVSSLADSMRKAGTAMSLGVTAPLVGIAATAIDSAADFEQSLNIMAQVSGATADQMAQLQQQALDLGASTSFSAGEAAQAQLELAKAGMKPMEVFAAMPGVLDMAAAGGMGVAQAAEIAANAVNTFGLEASSTTDIANMLAAAANASSVDITDLAAGMAMAGSVFASAGQSIDDLNIAMALLGNNGIKGSDAGTSLKTALMRLTAPTDEAAAALADLGVNVFDAQGNMREFPDILADLQQGLYGTNAVTVTSSNLTAEQAKRMEYLKSTISKTQTQLANYASGVAGVAQSENDKIVAQDRLNRTLTAAQAEYAQLAAIGGTTSTVMKTLTEEQRQQALSTIFGADAIRSISVLLSEGTDGWNEMADAIGVAGAATDVANSRMKGMRGAIEYLKGSIDSFLIGAALPYLDMMGNFVRMTADGLTAIGSLPRPLMDAAVAFGAVLAAAGPLMLAITSISAAIGFLLSPVGLLVAGVAAVAAGFVLWQQNFGNVQGRAAALAGMLKDMAESTTGIDFDAIIEGLRAFGNYISAIVEDGDYLNDWLTHLPESLAPAAEAFGHFVAAVGGLVQTGDVQAFVGELRDMFPEAAAQVDTAIAAMRVGWATAWDAMRTGFDTAWQAIQPALTAAWVWLQVALPAALGWLQSAWTAAWPAMQSAWDTLWGVLQPAWTTAQTWMQTTLPGALTSLQTAWEAAWPALQTAWDTTWAALSAAWTLAKAWLDTTLPGALTALQTAWEQTWPALQVASSTAWEGIKGTFDSLKAAFTGVQTGASQVSGTLAGFWAQVSTIGAMLAAFFAPAMERLQGAFSKLPESLAPLMPKLQELGEAFGGLFQALQPFVLLVGAALAIAVDFGINRLTTVFETLPGILGPVIDQITATIKLITVILTETVTAVKAVIDGDWATVWESAKTIAGGFSTFFRGLFSRLGTFMMAVAVNMTQPVIDTLRDLGVDVDPILNGIKKTFETIWGGIQSAIQAVIDIVDTLTDTFSGFKSFLDGLSLNNPFAPLVDAYNTIAGGITKIGTPGGMDNDPNTPWRGGTSYYPGGIGMMNEVAGLSETVILPAGSRIMTAAQSNQQGAGGQPPQITVNMGGVTIAKQMDVQAIGYTLANQIAAALG